MMGRRLAATPLAAALTLLSLAAAPGEAQFSPGKLSAPHAEIDDNRNCRGCHSADRGVTEELCFSCHELLGQRAEAGLGLHARPEYRSCETCHIEHNGREFELIWWGDDGMSAFDHLLTGQALRGAHAELGCRDCHRRGLQRDPSRLLVAGKDLDRTFLGLGRGCRDCHESPHDDQFEGRADGGACSSCHEERRWSPAPRFDHAETPFPLLGSHADLACASCHEPGAPGSAVVFRPLRHGSCASCHADPHAGRLGGRCQSCHSEERWDRITPGRFDHDRTRFSLVGRHQRLACASCHAPDQGLRFPSFETCADCHADPHQDQLTRRADGGRCDACHTQEDFSPALFGVAEHAETAFPLAGAHLAVRCSACHPILAGASPRQAGGPRRYRYEATSCADCHADPHAGQADAWMGSGGCEDCHAVESWREVSFDHDQTLFALLGAHAELSCSACHPGETSVGSTPSLPLAGAPTLCAGCHEDPHRGQFDSPSEKAACSTCHGPIRWRPASFDHARDTEFPLTGGHAPVPCASCHLSDQIGERSFVLYRPTQTACSACHARAASDQGDER